MILQTSSEQAKEAAAAEVGVKAGVTGNIRQCDFRKFYEPKGGRALGEGVSGQVHMWTHIATGHLVAVKSVQKVGMTPDGIDNLKQEIQLLAMLDHPNIVKIREAFEDERAITIIMEICSGGELFDNLAEQSNYTQQVSTAIISESYIPSRATNNMYTCSGRPDYSNRWLALWATATRCTLRTVI